MQFTATLREILAPIEGQGANGTWKRQDIIVETHEQFPKKVCISIWGDKVNVQELVVGQPYSIDVNIESREYNGRWFTDVKAWKMTSPLQHLTPPQRPSGPPSEPLSSELEAEEDDGLPF
jgi:hypothetical protein